MVPTPVLLPGKSHGWRGLAGYAYGVVKNWTRLSNFTFNFHCVEKKRHHSADKEPYNQGYGNLLQYWKIPWTKEPGRLQPMGSLRVGHDWTTSLSLFSFMHWRRKWQPTPLFYLENSKVRETWWAAIYGVAQSRTRLKQFSSSRSSEYIMGIKVPRLWS